MAIRKKQQSDRTSPENLTLAQSLLKLGEIFYLCLSIDPMVNRTFVEVAGVKPRGGHAAMRGRLPGGGFTRLALAAAMAVVLFSFSAGAQDAGRKSLHGHVPPALARFHLQPTGHLSATNRLHLAIGLPLRNQAALDKLLSEIYSPASTNYHRYLTPE